MRIFGQFDPGSGGAGRRRRAQPRLRDYV